MPKKGKAKIADDLANDFDKWSVMSNCSSEGSQFSELDDEGHISNPIDKIESDIDNLKVKRPDTRIKYLKVVIKCLQTSFIEIDSSWNYFSTLTDGLCNCIENGNDMDSIYAAEALSLLCFQYPDEDLVDLGESLISKLERIIRDTAKPVKLRSECCSAISNLIWMSDYEDYGQILEIMSHLETIFKSACLKGDGKSPVLSDPVVEFYKNALYCWFRMLLNLPIKMVVDQSQKQIPSLMSILQTSNVTMRICAAEIIALCYEQIRENYDETYKGSRYKELVELIREFSVENFKNKSKNDLKKQRSTMRHVLEYILSFKSSRTKVNFSNLEHLELANLEEHFRYDSVCDTLKIGVNKHLKGNSNVREIFGLGPVLVQADEQTLADRRLNKSQIKYEHQLASKMRKDYVKKNRSVKADVLNSSLFEDC